MDDFTSVYSSFLNRIKEIWDFVALFNILKFYPLISTAVIVFTQRKAADKQTSPSGINPHSGVYVPAHVVCEKAGSRVVSFPPAPQCTPSQISTLPHTGSSAKGN